LGDGFVASKVYACAKKINAHGGTSRRVSVIPESVIFSRKGRLLQEEFAFSLPPDAELSQGQCKKTKCPASVGLPGMHGDIQQPGLLRI